MTKEKQIICRFLKLTNNYNHTINCYNYYSKLYKIWNIPHLNFVDYVLTTTNLNKRLSSLKMILFNKI